ncbi:MAG: PhzF family phenazine biosynthesis protein [Rhodothermales bacterium]
MTLTIYHVDAFTDEPFAGNPAAVCVLPAPRTASWMQHLAREMNLSETAYLVRRDDGFDLRWFTPTHEVDLCGHATLAGAHVLWETGLLQPDEEAAFFTKSGRLTARRDNEWIRMDFPAEPARETTPPDGLEQALGAPLHYCGKNRMDYLALLDTEETLRSLTPDTTLLASIDTRGVIVTAPSRTDAYDFVSRFFAPQLGILEDPVTGSAHCCLGPFWHRRLGTAALVGYQASARGGVVHMQVGEHRVLLGGQAVTVMRGELVAGV